LRVEQLIAPCLGKGCQNDKGRTDGSVQYRHRHACACSAAAIKFANLGLLIVDEEQRFGVKQKEKLKELKANVHVLTLTATPIPRTLQMSLSGVKDMSLIATPPVDRLAMRTFVMPFDPVVIREAILREHYRGGQTFYVCPRISDMTDLEILLKDLVPEVKVISAHGQMTPTELEDRMTAFYDGQYDSPCHQHHRIRFRYPDRQHHDRPPRRYVRPRAALSNSRAHWPLQGPRLRLSDL
jgi:transcription-repair coupling factor (superfamily II helicase)